MERKMKTKRSKWVWVRCGKQTIRTLGDQANWVFSNLKGVLSYQTIGAPGTFEAFVRAEVTTQIPLEVALSEIYPGLKWTIVPPPEWAI